MRWAALPSSVVGGGLHQRSHGEGCDNELQEVGAICLYGSRGRGYCIVRSRGPIQSVGLKNPWSCEGLLIP